MLIIPGNSLDNDAAWTGFALLMASDQRRVRELLCKAQDTPDVDAWMAFSQSYWLIKPGGLKTGQTKAVRMQHILHPLIERHPHNYPWEFRRVILSGWIQHELRGPGKPTARTILRAGDTYYHAPDDYHRITDICTSEPVITLDLLGMHMGVWGFDVGGQYIKSRQYLGY